MGDKSSGAIDGRPVLVFVVFDPYTLCHSPVSRIVPKHFRLHPITTLRRGWTYDLAYTHTHTHRYSCPVNNVI